MLSKFLDKNPALGIFVMPLIGLVILGLGYDFYQKLLVMEQTGGSMRINRIVYLVYQIAGSNGVMVLFVLMALFFFYQGFAYFKKTRNPQA